MAVNQKLLGVGISSFYYKEDGNIYLDYFVSGDSLAGAGAVTIKIELDNTKLSEFNFNANNPGYSHGYSNITLNDKTPGKSHNIKITASKNGTIKNTSSSKSYPTQTNIDAININYTHKETNPPLVLKDVYRFTGWNSNYGVVRYSVDSEVTDSSSKYDFNSQLELPNDDNLKHTIYYRYKCGELVVSKSYVVDHSGAGPIDPDNPDYRVPYVYPTPVLTQTDNEHYTIDISNFDLSENGVTDSSKLIISVTYNNKTINYKYSDFIDGVLTVNLKYSTKVNCYIYNTEYTEDSSKVASINFVYTTPIVKLIPPEVIWKTTRLPDGTVKKTGITVSYNLDKVIRLNSAEFPNLLTDGKIYIIYTTDGNVPNIGNTVEKIDLSSLDIQLPNCIAYFRLAYVYNNEKIDTVYSDCTRFVSNIDGSGNPYYFDYEKPPIQDNKRICSYLDIIYNNDYNNSKSLESINYILNYFDDRYKVNAANIYNVAEDGLRRRYAGYYLDIYTDETQAINLKLSNGSNDTDENNKDTYNHYDDYKFAKFDKGSWNFNYFRNGFNGGNNELSETELTRACHYIYYNPSTKQNEVHIITEEDLKNSPLYKSDNRSLIYGKYIVARFIFNNDDAAHRFKFENITFNIQPY